MEKLAKILLLILNIFIDTFLVIVGLILILWMIFGVSPEKSVQNTLTWIQESWNFVWGIESRGNTGHISQEFQKRAHREIYVAQPNKKDETAPEFVTQPYK